MKHKATDYITESGKAMPLGAHATASGVNFSIISRHADKIRLLLFHNPDDSEPCWFFDMETDEHRTGDIWHVHIKGLGPGTCYLYQAWGPVSLGIEHCFDEHKYLLDPYATALSSGFSQSPPEKRDFPKCLVINPDDFDWQGDRPLNYPLRKSVIYETNLRGVTAHDSSGVSSPGTYAGLIEKIPYFKKLGITSLELLPIQEFNEYEYSLVNPENGETLQNYWGYSTVSFFAPKFSYSSDKTPGGQIHEFKRMVREFHKNGIEIILDVVFNHTAEGNELGPTYSFKGLDNSLYYLLSKDASNYMNFSGCGNTLNCNHPILRTFILDCLRYWVIEMHIDGFRFDLGSILGRNSLGELMENPPILERIAEDPVLKNTKIIAEAWDAAGAYQVGSFPGGRWAEWNDRFRDDVRSFWRGDETKKGAMATRLTGSSDLYLRDGRKPFHSINFITSHDGFTLNDLVSYNNKHNLANGEQNRDGHNYNHSYNWGVEGPGSKRIEKIRNRILKSFMATLFLSQGTPMMTGGDEFRRTQKGNNNAWCQNNDISWFDWERCQDNEDLFRFTRELIAFRLRHQAFQRPEFYKGKDSNHNRIPDITWFNEKGDEVDWDKDGSTFSFRLDGSHADIAADIDDNDFFIMLNGSPHSVTFHLPEVPGNRIWFRKIDTGLPSGEDILPKGRYGELHSHTGYTMRPHTIVLLMSR